MSSLLLDKYRGAVVDRCFIFSKKVSLCGTGTAFLPTPHDTCRKKHVSFYHLYQEKTIYHLVFFGTLAHVLPSLGFPRPVSPLVTLVLFRRSDDWNDFVNLIQPNTRNVPAPSNGWCLNPKGLQNSTPYHPFGTRWRVQVWYEFTKHTMVFQYLFRYIPTYRKCFFLLFLVPTTNI